MAIFLAQTTVSILREKISTRDSEPTYSGGEDLPARVQVATGVRATISSPSGSTSGEPGDRTVYSAALVCDPFSSPLTPQDLIRDDSTGIYYNVNAPALRNGWGIDHWEASLTRTKGL